MLTLVQEPRSTRVVGADETGKVSERDRDHDQAEKAKKSREKGREGELVKGDPTVDPHIDQGEYGTQCRPVDVSCCLRKTQL